MHILEVAIAMSIGFVIGLMVAYFYWRSRSSVGNFIVKRDNDGRYSYVLELEEEPEGLHNSRYIFFRVKKT